MNNNRLFALILSFVMIFTLAVPMGGYAEEYVFQEDEFVFDDGGDVWFDEYIEEPVEEYWSDKDFVSEEHYFDEQDQLFEESVPFEEDYAVEPVEEYGELVPVDPYEDEIEEFTLSDADTFDAAELTVTDPEAQTVAEGATATFHVEATGGSGEYTYQWQVCAKKSWLNTGLNGNTTDTLSFVPEKAWSGRTYRCIVTDSTGESKTTAGALLTVTDEPAEFAVTDPEAQTVAEGATATFHVEATGGSGEYTYQWQVYVNKKWQNTSLDGNTTDTLSFVPDKAWSGRSYRCIVKDTAGASKTTAGAKLTVDTSTIVSEPFVFKKIDGTNNLALIGYTGNASSITVPNSVDGMIVTEIGVSPLPDGEKGVFEGNTTLTSITLPNSITAIREKSFKGCTRLSTMTTY